MIVAVKNQSTHRKNTTDNYTTNSILHLSFLGYRLLFNALSENKVNNYDNGCFQVRTSRCDSVTQSHQARGGDFHVLPIPKESAQLVQKANGRTKR